MGQSGNALLDDLRGDDRPWPQVAIRAGDTQDGPLAHVRIAGRNPRQRGLSLRFGDAGIPFGRRVDQQRAERLTHRLPQPVQFGRRGPLDRASKTGPHRPDQAPSTP